MKKSRKCYKSMIDAQNVDWVTLTFISPILPNPRFKTMNSLKKKAPFLISGVLCITSTSLSPSRAKGSSGPGSPGWQPWGSFSGSTSLKPMRCLKRKNVQVTWPPPHLCMSPGNSQRQLRWKVRYPRIFINPNATLQPCRSESGPSLRCSEAPYGPPTQVAPDSMLACGWHCFPSTGWRSRTETTSNKQKHFQHGSHYQLGTGNAHQLPSRASCLPVIL